MLAVTVDSNVYISALLFGGKPLEVLERAIAGEIVISISEEILTETLRVLRQKFRLPDDRLLQAREYIEACTQSVRPTRSLNVVPEDPDDNRVVECAVASGSALIITGDHDLLRRTRLEGIDIVGVSDFLNRSAP